MFDVARPKCYEVYDHLRAHRERLQDVVWLADFLRPHCKFRKLSMRGSALRILQIPNELAEFLVWMSNQRVDRYLEVGTSTGGSWFMIDSYLRAANATYKGSVGYDRKLKLRDWEAYRARFAGVEFRCQNSSAIDLDADEQFDLAFVDACHQEEWVWHDFGKVRANCRFVAFHDIVLQGGSTVYKFWEVARRRYPSWEFIDRDLSQTCGIGILQVR